MTTESKKRFKWSLTGPDAVPEDAWEPEGDANLNDPEDEVVGVPAAQVNPEGRKPVRTSFPDDILGRWLNQLNPALYRAKSHP